MRETFRQAGVKILSAGRELAELEAFRAQSIAEGKAHLDDKEWRSLRSIPVNEGPWLRPRPGRPSIEGHHGFAGAP